MWVMLGLLAYALLSYRRALGLPFLNDDYTILDKVVRGSFADVWAPRELLFAWYRPWSREFHYWALYQVAGLREGAYHTASFGLWFVVLYLYFSLVRRLTTSLASATLATVGMSALALWSSPIAWVAGVQELWMLLFSLLYLHAVARGWRAMAVACLLFALLSKETAAVLPPIALALLVLVEHRTWRRAVQGTLPHWITLAAWGLLHPTLTSRLFGPLRSSTESLGRPGPGMTLLKTVLAQFNLEGRFAPEAGWLATLVNAALGAALLGAILVLGQLRATADPATPTPLNRDRGVLAFAAIWAASGWAILFLPSIGWHAYYGSLGTLGCWLAVGTLLQRQRRLALALVVLVATMREINAATPSWDWGSYWYQKRAGDFLEHIRGRLFAMHPVLPRHSRLYFTNLPNNIGLLAGDGPAIRIWYRDASLRAQYYSAYRMREPSDSLGGDYFFRFDSTTGLIEVPAGSESTSSRERFTQEWRHGQLGLVTIFLESGNYRAAADTYARLWIAAPDHAQYALYAATLYEVHGDSEDASRYYGIARSILGPERVRDFLPGLLRAARARNSQRGADEQPPESVHPP